MSKFNLRKIFKGVRRIASIIPNPQSSFNLLKFKFQKGKTKKIGKFNLILNSKNDNLSKNLILHTKREIFLNKFLKNYLKKGDIILDIGSHIGYYPILEANFVGKTGKIYAVEPVSKNFSLLKKNIEYNNLSKIIKPYKLALCSKNKKTFIYVRKNTMQSSLLKYMRQKKAKKKQKTQCLTIDNFLKNKIMPNLIRMDIEGEEANIFQGAKNTLSYGPDIILELHTFFIKTKNFYKMYSLLKEYKYKIKKIIINPYEEWLSHYGEIRKDIKLLTYLAGDACKFGSFRGSWKKLEKIFFEKKFAPHIFLSKK